MSRYSAHPSDQATTADQAITAQDRAIVVSAARRADRACCCTARPMIVALMPPAAGRPHATDLLLCGHHYRLARRALAAAGALVAEIGEPQPDDRAYPMIHSAR